MTASYAGAAFETRTAANGLVPRWARQVRVTRRPIPNSDREDVQSTGLGNQRVTLPAYITSDADMAALIAAQGVTRRQLTNPFGTGESYANVILAGVSAPRRRGWEPIWLCDLTFEIVDG
jgi:hypothetical protein